MKNLKFKKGYEKNDNFYIRGFTLAETIIATFVFITVVSVIAGVFIQQVRLNRVAIAMITMNDAMSLTLEQISREIRTGTSFCTSMSPITTGGAGLIAQCVNLSADSSGAGDAVLQFVNSKGETVRYRINNLSATESSIERALDISASGTTCAAMSGTTAPSDANFCYLKVTSDNVYVNSLKFVLAHNDQIATEYYPPRITVNMALTSNEPDVKSYGIVTNTQLTISARNF